MHVFLVVAVRGRAVGVVAPFALDAGGADRPGLGHRQPDVVHAVVGEELGARVELVAVPPLVLQHAELGEPLRDEEEVADGAGAREGARHVRRPLDLDGQRAAGRRRLRKRRRQHRPIVRVAIVGRDEAQLTGEIDRRAAAGEPKRRDVDARAILRARLPDGLPRAQLPFALPRRAVVAPGVPVEVELQIAGRLRRDVAPRDDLGSGDGSADRIERHVDGVVGVSRRERRRHRAGDLRAQRDGGRERQNERRRETQKPHRRVV